MYISMGHMVNLPVIKFFDPHSNPTNYMMALLILTICFIIYGFDILRNGYKNLIHKTPNMDTLVSIGVLSSYLYSLYSTFMIINGKYEFTHMLYFESVSMVIFFIKLGRFIDLKSKNKTKEAIRKLSLITPEKALVLDNGKQKEVTIDDVKIGMTLVAKPGMKVAVDGVITKGETHLDETFITGESIPVKKKIGDNVVAGSINYDGLIFYRAEKIGRESTISGIVKLVLEATNTKSKIARLVDKISSYFVPVVLIIAFLSLIVNLVLRVPVNELINTFVSVLVVACPCALGLATPLAIVVSEGLCASHGILVKNSETLELINKVDTIVFDKTGTLTYGNLKISKLYNYSNESNDRLLSKVCSLEAQSSHPISKAFTDYQKEKDLKMYEVENFKNIDGIGLEGKINGDKIYLGNAKILKKLKIENKYQDDEEKLSLNANSVVYVVINKEIKALIGVSDIIRNNITDTIWELKDNNIEVIMLTGDNENTAKIIADSLGIKKVIADVLPEEKASVIKKMKDKGHIVMMVGDGINDAPSLANANIGVSISNATDIATQTADVILLNDDIKKINHLIKISKYTIRNIKQNLFWAFFYNVLMIPAALGLYPNIKLNPMLASLAMTLSSLTVVFNALRLKNIKLERRDENV
ncbi:MAG TPA: hypothetical protein DCE23_02175 [Firmicutes bacterium]|nr:hypothetical protein [Bacillota bacterium]